MFDKLPEFTRDRGREWPKGVSPYNLNDGTEQYFYQAWSYKAEKRKVKYGFKTPEQAAYARKLFLQGHHWDDMPEERQDAFGFVYQMTHRETGRIYIGSKQFIFWDGPRGGYKCTAPADKDFFDATLWVESDWAEYTGSSYKVNKMVGDDPSTFEYKVLHLAKNKLELHLLEVNEQVTRGVLDTLDEDGNYLYLNENIMGVEYRTPVPREKLYAAKDAEAKKLRDYYLRPNLCGKCGNVIPYGTTWCCVKQAKHEQLIGS